MTQTDLGEKPAKYQWQWRVSTDRGESFGQPFATREDAAAYARGYGGGLIAETLQGDFDLSIDGSDILLQLGEGNAERCNEDGDFLDSTPEQDLDLGVMLTATISEWARKHAIDTRAYVFAAVRNEKVIRDELEPAGANPEPLT